MKRSGFWKPFVLGLIATPICLFLGIASGGAGHGNYLWARLLFPYTMLMTWASESLTAPAVALAILQFPLYGAALGLANQQRKLPRMGLALSVIHTLAVVAFFLFPNTNFS